MSDKRISIIIPAYNEERYLAACLDSVAKQTVTPYEVFVIDNNSSDSTATVAAQYSFVRLQKETRQGIVHARNAGFNAASGDILARTDADVVLPADWVEKILSFYEDPGHVGFGLSGNGRPHNLPMSQFLGWLQGQIAFRVNRMLLGHFIFFGSNMALTRQMWQVVGPLTCIRTDIHEDLDLAIHSHRAGYAIAYRETLQVSFRAAHITHNHGQLLGNLMLWPKTLRAHGKRSWVFGWAGALLLYGLSPLLVAVSRLTSEARK